MALPNAATASTTATLQWRTAARYAVTTPPTGSSQQVPICTQGWQKYVQSGWKQHWRSKYRPDESHMKSLVQSGAQLAGDDCDAVPGNAAAAGAARPKRRVVA
jgi:hypothetical protein